MTSTRSEFVGALTLVACVVAQASTLCAQTIEVTPFAGYRFGGDFFELITGRPVDADGAPALGVAVDIPLSPGIQVEGLFSHQYTDLTIPPRPYDPRGAATRWRMSVDHWQVGGVQELDAGRTRPFLTAMFGLTRYAAEADSEIRFTLGGGGGVKLLPSRHLGVRLDGRVFATFADAGGTLIACSPGACFIALHAHVVWQAEFTAGAVFRFH